jgi:DNA-binding CsgD family transcriptional regulator
VVAAAAAALAARLTDAERQLLVWVAEEVPRRQIAEWLGENYEAVRKRVQRLARRLQGEARRHAAALPAAERHEFERFLRRAGHPEAGAGAARAAGPPRPVDRAAPFREVDP